MIELLDEHGDALFADFLRFYRIDLRDLHRGRISPVLVLALVTQLPLDSAYVTALRGPEYAGWDRHAYQMADIYDAVNALTYLYQATHSDKPKQLKPPSPYPRPGVQVAEKAAKPSPLLARLRGEDVPAPMPGPGSKVPLPPAR